MKLEIGSKAPEFSLFDTKKQLVKLSDYSGKTVLILFFPLAFTSVCTAELCSVRDNITFYNDVKAEVLGISVDSLYTLDRFREEQQLNFPLLSDFNKETSRAYGAIYEEFGFEMKGVSKRAAFVVDGEGMIRYAEVLENAKDLPDFQKISSVLTQLDADF